MRKLRYLGAVMGLFALGLEATDALIFVLGLLGILYTLGNLILRIKMMLERIIR
ncbi:MAG: hypothetical protein NWE88_00935 [Candidatus Bathyarchaeota archaeon]|nr:hypothetical protein [Candidatus Bathyarchaeota archaeon]